MKNVFSSPRPMPSAPLKILRRLHQAGFEAYAVGGCVRDVLLGLTPDDWDIATDALPQQTAALFADCRVIETGLQHGTVTVLFEGDAFEITTFRVDSDYADNRHPDAVTFTRSLEEDVKRRDFTIGAMAWHDESGIHDFFNGAEDLRAGILRCVGNPYERFAEDALRILRAVRFCATFGFQPTDDLLQAAVTLKDTVKTVSVERIRVELTKALCGDFVTDTFTAFLKVWQTVLPEADFSPQTKRLLAALPATITLRLAALLQTADAASVLKRLKTDNQTIAAVTALQRAVGTLSPTTDTVTLTKALHVYGENTLRDAVTVCAARAAVNGEDAAAWQQTAAALTALINTNPCYTLKDLAVDGEDLKVLGLQGQPLGEALQRLLSAVMENRCHNEKQALLTFIRKKTDR